MSRADRNGAPPGPVAPRRAFTLSAGAHRIELGETTRIMGIVNVTPDSFSDGGRFFSADNAVARAVQLVRDGADIIDVGGESTRPFSDFVDEEEEIRRVVPVIRALAGRIDVPISIDTNKASVARAAIEAGATILNDVGALRLDPLMAKVAAESGAPVIVMHMLGTPKTMQEAPVYKDLFGEIHDFLAEAVGRALDAGVSRSKIVIDPGIGFGKTVTHNLMLLGDLSKLRELDAPILIGPSRKAFIRMLLKKPAQADISTDQPIVETGTQAAAAAAVLAGAHILRVHDVTATAGTVRILDAVRDAVESEQDKI